MWIPPPSSLLTVRPGKHEHTSAALTGLHQPSGWVSGTQGGCGQQGLRVGLRCAAGSGVRWFRARIVCAFWVPIAFLQQIDTF